VHGVACTASEAHASPRFLCLWLWKCGKVDRWVGYVCHAAWVVTLMLIYSDGGATDTHMRLQNWYTKAKSSCNMIDRLIFVRVSTITAIWTVGHRLWSTPTNGYTFTALSLPWWSPIQVLTGLDVTNFSDWVTEQALVTTADLPVAIRIAALSNLFLRRAMHLFKLAFYTISLNRLLCLMRLLLAIYLCLIFYFFLSFIYFALPYMFVNIRSDPCRDTRSYCFCWFCS